MIKVLDSFLSQREFDSVLNFCQTSSFYYGEKDNKNTPPTGAVSDFLVDSDISLLFHNKLIEFEPRLKQLRIDRTYVNCFSPSENPYFHSDGESGITCLYYPNKDWSLDEGGETQFIINNEIKGIFPIPNRMVIFNANILHKATSFRFRHRFSIAIKYE